MDIDQVVQLLKDERDRINAALTALEGSSSQKQGTRVLSAAARARISRAQKKRWAAAKKKKSK